MSIIGVLGVVFVTLKLIGMINWSWWLVLLPFYGGALLFVSLLFLGAALSFPVKRRIK